MVSQETGLKLINKLVIFKKILMKRISFKKDIITSYQLINYGDFNHNVFFGYYDITPFNPQTDEVIYLSVSTECDKADIILRDLKNNQYQKLTSTLAWNWQQGCRLRWMPGENEKDIILFNDFMDNQYVTRIFNIRNYQERILDYPLYDITNNGTFGITLNFERLGTKRPGYGYTIRKYYPPANFDNEGIWLVDITKNTATLILRYKEIMQTFNQKEFDVQNCYINHLSFSPSGNKFLFFWIEIKDTYHQANLLVYNIITQNLILLENKMKVSHYVWENDETIICTSYNKDYKCEYYRYSLDGSQNLLCPNILHEDGHPSILNKNVLITDTYPDKNGYQKLLKIDVENSQIFTLLKIYSSHKSRGEKRTDLHPRLNKEKNIICFDANVKGYRKIYFLKAWNN